MTASISIPHVNVKDHDVRRILQPMRELIERHVRALEAQSTLISQLQAKITVLETKVT